MQARDAGHQEQPQTCTRPRRHSIAPDILPKDINVSGNAGAIVSNRQVPQTKWTVFRSRFSFNDHLDWFARSILHGIVYDIIK
jgi:hypothetical protein